MGEGGQTLLNKELSRFVKQNNKTIFLVPYRKDNYRVRGVGQYTLHTMSVKTLMQTHALITYFFTHMYPQSLEKNILKYPKYQFPKLCDFVFFITMPQSNSLIFMIYVHNGEVFLLKVRISQPVSYYE